MMQRGGGPSTGRTGKSRGKVKARTISNYSWIRHWVNLKKNDSSKYKGGGMRNAVACFYWGE